MRRVASLAAVIVMLVMMMPALACATTSKLTRMERDCCQQMHGNCGEMAKTGCCQIEIHSDLHQVPSHVVSAPILPMIVVSILHSFATKPPVPVGHNWHFPEEHSPPGLLFASTTVLRV